MVVGLTFFFSRQHFAKCSATRVLTRKMIRLLRWIASWERLWQSPLSRFASWRTSSSAKSTRSSAKWPNFKTLRRQFISTLTTRITRSLGRIASPLRFPSRLRSRFKFTAHGGGCQVRRSLKFVSAFRNRPSRRLCPLRVFSRTPMTLSRNWSENKWKLPEACRSPRAPTAAFFSPSSLANSRSKGPRQEALNLCLKKKRFSKSLRRQKVY